MKFLKNLCITSLILALLTMSAFANPQAPEWVNFFGDVTINGNPAPVGTVVEAYDPDGVMCGSYTVGTIGIYGLLAANRDDITTPGIDEGAVPGDSITLKVNGITATPTVIDTLFVNSGLTWTSNGEQNNVNLAITGQTIAFTAVTLPADTLAAPGWNIKFAVGIRNDGNGTDYYSVVSQDDTAASPGWTTVDQDSVSHADVGATTTLFFEVSLPLFGGGGDTTFVVHYTVMSAIDNSVNHEDSVTIYKSVTDIGDGYATVPDRFNLFQNYPNPFNPTTNISFSLEQRSSVRIEIINISGQLIDVRNLGNLPAGNHDIEYDASSLSSGVYFYRMTTDNGSISKKMVLLK